MRASLSWVMLLHAVRCRRECLVDAFRFQKLGFRILQRDGARLRPSHVDRLPSDSRRFNGRPQDGEASSAGILEGLNPAQVEAVIQPLSAITRVVAGPGSGKTRVLTARIAHLLQQDPYSRILAVTFTNKAAGEMQQRLEKLLRTHCGVQTFEEAVGTEPQPWGLERVTLGTFHSVCAKILRWNGDYLATLPMVVADMRGSRNATVLDRSFSILDEAGQLRVLRDALEDMGINLQAVDLKPRPVLTALSEVKAKVSQGFGMAQLASKETGNSRSKAMEVATKVYLRYREQILSKNCLDFDDLIFLTRELLMFRPEIREMVQRRWAHVLVDEFQDTSRSQMDLVKLLTSYSLFVVGDADQSIYSWRGAHAGSLSDFEVEYAGYSGGVNTVYLMENYRSTSNIIRAAQKVISHQPRGVSGADKLRRDMKPIRGAGAKPRILAFEDDAAEADFAVTTVKEALAAGNYSSDHSVAFIYRTNAQSRALEEACVRGNLPYVIFGSATSFYKRQEIQDCLCFLRFVYNGRDRISMLRAMSTPKRGIGDAAIAEFDEYCSLFESFSAQAFPDRPYPTPLDALLSLTDNRSHPDPNLLNECFSTRPLKLFRQFSGQIRALYDQACSLPLDKALKLVIDGFDIMSHLDKLSKSTAEFEERKRNVDELKQATVKYASRGPCLRDSPLEVEGEVCPLGAFLDDVALITELADSSVEERFVVNMMTIHASKGTEFDTVFVVGAEDGTLPIKRAIDEGEASVAFEEEKRLCYVAMTRAKTELFLTRRKLARVFTKDGISTIRMVRSRFLDVLVSKEGGSKDGKSSHANNKSPVSAPLLQTKSSTESSSSAKSKATSAQPRFTSTIRPRIFPSPVAQPFKAKPLEGTTSVYSKGKPVTRVEVRTPMTSPSQGGGMAQSTRRTRSPAPATTHDDDKSLDSTWFFPVGSSVVHKTFGTGTVLPANSNSVKELMVLVKFNDGTVKRFSATGSDIAPSLS